MSVSKKNLEAEKTVKKGSEAINIIGVELYGKKFSIADKVTYENYKSCYESFVKSLFEQTDKGVLVVGGIGAGKTAMMRIMQRLFKDTERKFLWINAYDLKDMAEVYTTSEIKMSYGSDLKCDLYIDDIGFSMDVKRYGNTVNIITEILMERYELFVSSGFRTHLSSNIPTFIKNNTEKIPTLENVYGERVLDRIKEMCDLITFKGESKRK
jgi:DNA replication protein DnaC